MCVCVRVSVWNVGESIWEVWVCSLCVSTSASVPGDVRAVVCRCGACLPDICVCACSLCLSEPVRFVSSSVCLLKFLQMCPPGGPQPPALRVGNTRVGLQRCPSCS